MKIRNAIFYVNNIEPARSFYDSLGFTMFQDFGKFVSYKTNTENTLFSIMEPDDKNEKVPGKQVCAFWINDIDREYEKYQSLGVEIEMELTEAPYGKTFIARDLDGNRIEYVEERINE